MMEEVTKARNEDPECLFAFHKEKEAFNPNEVEKLANQHRLEWTRQFGDYYLVGGRGLPPVD